MQKYATVCRSILQATKIVFYFGTAKYIGAYIGNNILNLMQILHCTVVFYIDTRAMRLSPTLRYVSIYCRLP